MYSELLGFKHTLIAGTEESMAQMDEPAAITEVARTDAMVLSAERQRFERRLRFWNKRHKELAQN